MSKRKVTGLKVRIGPENPLAIQLHELHSRFDIKFVLANFIKKNLGVFAKDVMSIDCIYIFIEYFILIYSWSELYLPYRIDIAELRH